MRITVKFTLAIFVFGLLWMLSGQTASAQTDDLTASVRGHRAISRLKKSGDSDSLRAAFNQSRTQNGQAAVSVQGDDQLTVPNGAADDNFGYSIAVSGDTAVVGSPFEDIGANIDQGAAYVFIRNGTNWTQQTRLVASDGIGDDVFGFSVGISGDTIIVGAYAYDQALIPIRARRMFSSAAARLGHSRRGYSRRTARRRICSATALPSAAIRQSSARFSITSATTIHRVRRMSLSETARLGHSNRS